MAGKREISKFTHMQLRDIILGLGLLIFFIAGGIRFAEYISFDNTAAIQTQELQSEAQATDSKEAADIFLSININTATAAELEQLEGIGEAKAAAIISYRQSNGDFDSIEDIMNVSGIGTGIFEDISESIYVD